MSNVEYEILVYQYIQNFSKFSSGREASDIYKAILGLSVMKRLILAALIVAVSLSATALVAGHLQEVHAQVTVNNISGSGSVGSSTPGPAGPTGANGATGPAGPAALESLQELNIRGVHSRAAIS